MERNLETIRRVLDKVSGMTPSEREIMCLCAVAYEAGKQAGASTAKQPVQ